MIDHAIYTLSIITATALLAYVILWSGLQTFNANPSKRFMRIWPKLALYYAAYTMPIWALLLVFNWISHEASGFAPLSSPTIMLAMIAMGLYFYTVIVQPNCLRLRHQAVDLGLEAPISIAVLADLRIGLYSGKPRHIRKLVAKINELSVDAVLITGDWLYYPGADLVGQLMLFKGVNKPIYTVMSVSDLRYQSMNTTKQGQPLLEDTLASAFDVLDITYIGQQCWFLPPKNTHIVQTHAVHTKQVERSTPVQRRAMLCGWQDMPQHYSTEAKLKVCEKQILKASQLAQVSKEGCKSDVNIIVATNKDGLWAEIKKTTLPVIILASRLDSMTDLPKDLQPRPLFIAGAAKSAKSRAKVNNLLVSQRTNGNNDAQSAITAYTRFDSKRGLYQHGSAQVFISSGVGTRGLPFRVRRPTIDVLTIR